MTVQLLCNEYVIFVTAAEKVKRDYMGIFKGSTVVAPEYP